MREKRTEEWAGKFILHQFVELKTKSLKFYDYFHRIYTWYMKEEFSGIYN